MTMTKRKPVLLIDLDGVAFSFYEKFLAIWKERYPDREFIASENLYEFWIENMYPAEYVEDINAIIKGKGFFESLEPMPGAVEAMMDILDDGQFDPFICTAPDLDCPDQVCFSEKARSVEKHLGKEWLKRMIITKDKTLVRGDFLIDDKPIITGAMSPIWNRVIFTHAYNKNDYGLHMDDWSQWPDIREYLLESYYGKKKAA